MVTFQYPENHELRQIEPDLQQAAMADNPIFRYFPITSNPNDMLVWEVQDTVGGLQLVRGINGQPQRVQSGGSKRYVMIPGYYGEFKALDELELTRRAASIGASGAVSVTDLVVQNQEHLALREGQLVQKILWDLVLNGTFSVLDQIGQVMHMDTYAVRTVTPSTPWSTVATATPLQDFRDVKNDSLTLTSCRFDGSATAFMNSMTSTQMLKNTNANDIGGRRVISNSMITPMMLRDVNSFLLEEGLPKIELFDGTYVDANADGSVIPPQMFIPEGYVVVFGNRPSGAKLGEYRMTRNVNNPNGEPGSYVYVADSINSEMNRVPRRIEVHRGHNGGPVIFYPNGVVVMKVYTPTP